MVLYLDESYDQPDKRFLLLGLLFSPSKKLHRALAGIHQTHQCLDKHGNTIETKYNNSFSEHNYSVCKKFIDAFFESDSWFCSIVVDTVTTSFDLNRFGRPHESESIKKARVYKKFTELLVSKNARKIRNAVLLVDELKRCNHDRFIDLMRESFCAPGAGYSSDDTPIFRHISSVTSSTPENIRLSVCDLLLGCVLNNNLPTQNKFKNQIRRYLVRKLGTKDLLCSTWMGSNVILSTRRKFRIWYWNPDIKKAQIPNHQQ